MKPEDATGTLKHALNEYLKAQELEEGRAALSHCYWLAARQCVRDVIPANAHNSLEFSDAARDLLNFGLIEHHALEVARKALKQDADGHDVLLLCDSLTDLHHEATLRKGIAELKAELKGLQAEIESWPETQLDLIQQRDQRASSLLGPGSKSAHAMKLFAEIDEKLEPYQRLRRKVREGSTTATEQKNWDAVRHFVDSRRQQITDMLSGYDDDGNVALAQQAVIAAQAVEDNLAALNGLQSRRRTLEQQLVQQESASTRITRDDIERALLGELDALAGLARLGSRYARVSEGAVPLDEDVDWVNRVAARDACRHVIEFDPGIFDNALAERFGLPDVLLVPGVGQGLFDASRNRWVAPQRCAGSAIESLAHAAILYRLEVDDSHELLRSYGEHVPGVRSNLKLRTMLIRDYLLWMCNETSGEPTLPRATREWFESHIAPNKEHPRVPDEYRRLSAQELETELEDLGDDAFDLYRKGMILWLLDPDNRDAVIALIAKAAELAPDNREILYSLGVLKMRAGDYQRAIGAFQKFAEIAGRSWWSGKAIELCARCR